MTRFGELDTVLHGLFVSNLTDQDYIRSLTQRVFKRRVPGLRVDANLALGNYTAFMRVNVLNGILDRNNMATRVFVSMPDHRRKRCRFTGAGTTYDDTKPALVHDDIFQDWWQFQFFKCRNLCRNGSENRSDHALLNKRTYAETTNSLGSNCEVCFFGRVKFLDLLVVHDRTHHDRRLIRRQRRIRCFVDRAVDLDRRRKRRREKQIRTIPLDHFSQQVLR